MELTKFIGGFGDVRGFHSHINPNIEQNIPRS